MLDRLRELRRALNMTQGEFCKRLGVNQPTYSLWESGKSPIADRYIKTICAIFRVDEDWLRTGEGNMFVIDPEAADLIRVWKKLPISYKKVLMKIAKEFLALAKEEEKV